MYNANLSDVMQVMKVMQIQEIIVRTAPDMYFHTVAVQKGKDLLIDFVSEKRDITIGSFREMIGSSRKYTLPLLEYFDKIGLTARDGDIRVLIDN